MAELAARVSDLNRFMANIYPAFTGERLSPYKKDVPISPRAFVQTLIKVTESVDREWESVDAATQAMTLDIAYAAARIAGAPKRYGLKYHVVAPFLNFRVYRISTLTIRALPTLEAFLKKRGSEKACVRSFARGMVDSTFFEKTKRVLASYRAGNFKRYATDELREMARRAHENRKP
ncbi:MAG: hypothetical protein M1314_04440 [Firmicutes bacterium]|nr:hypothetical protein [Bacillota bacterium]